MKSSLKTRLKVKMMPVGSQTRADTPRIAIVSKHSKARQQRQQAKRRKT